MSDSTYIPGEPATTSTTVPAAAGTTAVVTVPTTAPTAYTGALPVTGGDIAGLTLLGALAFGAGTVLVRRTRRARP